MTVRRQSETCRASNASFSLLGRENTLTGVFDASACAAVPRAGVDVDW
jgi:hypothetical protein